MTKRRIAFIAAAVVLAAGVVAGREKPTLEIVAARASAPGAADGIDLARLERAEGAAPGADPFARKGLDPASARGGAARAKPSVPPLPFRYFGRITENGRTEVFVMRGDELLGIAPGQQLGEYRVEAIGESSIAFVYLPLKTKQTLDFQ